MKALEPVVLCQGCGQREYDVSVLFYEQDKGTERKELCLPCYIKLSEDETALTYRQWYKKFYDEEWTSEHALLDNFRNEYEAYCKDNGLIPYWGD